MRALPRPARAGDDQDHRGASPSWCSAPPAVVERTKKEVGQRSRTACSSRTGKSSVPTVCNPSSIAPCSPLVALHVAVHRWRTVTRYAPSTWYGCVISPVGPRPALAGEPAASACRRPSRPRSGCWAVMVIVWPRASKVHGDRVARAADLEVRLLADDPPSGRDARRGRWQLHLVAPQEQRDRCRPTAAPAPARCRGTTGSCRRNRSGLTSASSRGAASCAPPRTNRWPTCTQFARVVGSNSQLHTPST